MSGGTRYHKDKRGSGSHGAHAPSTSPVGAGSPARSTARTAAPRDGVASTPILSATVSPVSERGYADAARGAAGRGSAGGAVPSATPGHAPGAAEPAPGFDPGASPTLAALGPVPGAALTSGAGAAGAEAGTTGAVALDRGIQELVNDAVAHAMASAMGDIRALLEEKLDSRAGSGYDSSGGFDSASETSSGSSGRPITDTEFANFVQEHGFVDGHSRNPHQHAKLRTAGDDRQPRILDARGILAHDVLTDNGRKRAGNMADGLKNNESIAVFMWDANETLLGSIRTLYDQGQESDVLLPLARVYNTQREVYLLINQERSLLQLRAEAQRPDATDAERDAADFVRQHLKADDRAAADTPAAVSEALLTYKRLALSSRLRLAARDSACRNTSSAGVGALHVGKAKQADKRAGGAAQQKRNQGARGGGGDTRRRRGGGHDSDGSRDGRAGQERRRDDSRQRDRTPRDSGRGKGKEQAGPKRGKDTRGGGGGGGRGSGRDGRSDRDRGRHGEAPRRGQRDAPRDGSHSDADSDAGSSH